MRIAMQEWGGASPCSHVDPVPAPSVHHMGAVPALCGHCLRCIGTIWAASSGRRACAAWALPLWWPFIRRRTLQLFCREAAGTRPRHKRVALIVAALGTLLCVRCLWLHPALCLVLVAAHGTLLCVWRMCGCTLLCVWCIEWCLALCKVMGRHMALCTPRGDKLRWQV